MQKRIVLPLVITFLLAAGCGQMDTILSSTITYQASALVNDRSIDECGIAARGSEIRPYFVSSVTGDRDVTGLQVYIQDSGGFTAGEKVRYLLLSSGLEVSPSGEHSAGSGTAAGDSAGEGGNTPEGGSGNAGQRETEKNLEPGRGESAGNGAGTADSETARDSSGTETGTGGNGTAPDNAGTPDTGIAGTTGAGTGDAGRREEQGGTEGSSLPGSGQGTPADGSAGQSERIIAVSRLDGILPPMPLPRELAIGRYSLVFEVLGPAREILYRMEKPFFFIGDADFSLGEIFYYRSGRDASPVLPPGMTVMLEARVEADPRLDAWLVWYNGRQKIAESSVQSGSARILWKTPNQAGFQSVRAELFPFNPHNGGKNISGYRKELSMPLSLRNGRGAEEPGIVPALLAQYRLEGDLAALALPQGISLTNLKAEEQGEPLWLPRDRNYGLGLGAARAYRLPARLFLSPTEAGTLRLSFVFSPLEEGVIFSGSFVLRNDAGAGELLMELSWAEGGVAFFWSGGTLKGREFLAVRKASSEEWISAAIDLRTEDGHILPSLYLPEDFVLSAPEANEKEEPESRMWLPGVLAGHGNFSLGRTLFTAPLGAASPAEENAAPSPEAGSSERIEKNTETAAGGVFTASPPVQPEIPAAPNPVPLPRKGASGPAFILDELSLFFFPGSVKPPAERRNREIHQDAPEKPEPIPPAGEESAQISGAEENIAAAADDDAARTL